MIVRHIAPLAFCAIQALGTLHAAPANLINGEFAEPGSYPAAVRITLHYDDHWARCSAVKIGDGQLLTAGHCVQNTTDGSLADGEIYVERDAFFYHGTATFEVYPSYAALCANGCPVITFGLEYPVPDLAIITVDDNLADLPYADLGKETLAEHTPIVLSGFGGSSIVEVLRGKTPEAAQLQIAPETVGWSTNPLYFKTWDVSGTGEPSLSPGDSGGPVFLDNGREKDVVGINSNGLNVYSAYVRLSDSKDEPVATWLAGIVNRRYKGGLHIGGDGGDAGDPSPDANASDGSCLVGQGACSDLAWGLVLCLWVVGVLNIRGKPSSRAKRDAETTSA